MDNNLSIVKEKFRELPNNIEAEQSVIGSILVSNEIFSRNLRENLLNIFSILSILSKSIP